MSKLRKGVIKQQERKLPSTQKKSIAKQSQTASDAVARDNFLFRSSIRSFLLAVLFFIVSALSAGKFWPFNELRNYAGNAASAAFDLVTGIMSFLFFMFLVFAWGNALEIRGNVIEWKHVLICILMVTFVAIWGGAVSFIVFIGGAFGLLTLLWYMNR